MRIIRPYAKILQQGTATYPEDLFGQAMKQIEWCARISHRAEDKQTDDSWRRFLQSVVIDHGDWSVVEHVSVSVDAVVDRGITHEIVRHRLFSYTQESTRFVNYQKKMAPSFVYPLPEVECQLCITGDEVSVVGSDFGWHKDGQPCLYRSAWLQSIAEAEESYKRLVELEKWRPQEARSVFPNALASRIVITGNLRNWRHFFIMRTTAEAHPQMRQVMIPLLAEFKCIFPLLFDDIEPNSKQSESMRRIR